MTSFQNFDLEPFNPPWFLQNRHLQTAAANLLRPKNNVRFRRVRLDTPDHDFVDIDFADVDGNNWQSLGDKTPIVLVLHGLEGCAKTGYAYELYRQLAARGIRSVGMNYRSCSGEMNRGKHLYHAGKLDDLILVHTHLKQQFPTVPLGMVGISLGGNILLNYLGRMGDKIGNTLQAAGTISAPFDLAKGMIQLELGAGKPYTRYLLPKLKRKVQLKADIWQDEPVDIQRALSAKTFWEFDSSIAPLYGYKDAGEYYKENSAGQFLANISHPTLMVRALDDPFFGDDIPHQTIADNPCLHTGFVPHGGHVGFIEGWLNPTFWAERQVARWFELVLGD
jgi:predicted alpha/beta-fold hydrolase